jgi:hypothetical protein
MIDSSSLCAEITECILTPLGDRYRVIDAIGNARELVQWFLLKAVLAPATAAWSAVMLS